MSAFTIAAKNDPQVGRAVSYDQKGRRVFRVTLTGPTSYDITTGSALPAAKLPFTEVFELTVVAEDAAPNADGNSLRFVPGSPGAVRVYDDTNTEVVDTTDLSDSSWVVEIHGK